MKKIILILILLLINTNSFAADELISAYSKNNKFGLTQGNKIITEAKYNKLIRLKESSWLFLYKNKYGIISNSGEILVNSEYSQAQRLAGRFAKLGKNGKFSIYDEHGNLIIPHEYTNIDILYGKMFLVEKKYKFGLISYSGDIILAPIADDIYMPKPNMIKILYDGTWYEIEQKTKETISLPTDIADIDEDAKDYTVKQLIQKPIASTGYGVVSASDYFIKLFSSISPSYEKTIDELILNHGADTATILIKSSWLIKFPFVYAKNYINLVKAPNNGPFVEIKNDLKNKINN